MKGEVERRESRQVKAAKELCRSERSQEGKRNLLKNDDVLIKWSEGEFWIVG